MFAQPQLLTPRTLAQMTKALFLTAALPLHPNAGIKFFDTDITA